MTRRSEEEWRRQLSPQQYRILREAGTEPPFSGALLNNKQDGMYRCAACGKPLFDSAAKYDSGSGWPSFTAPVEQEAVDERSDQSHGMIRTEVRCSACESHLGHVFPDGPGPGGLRYCINSASLAFERAGESAKDPGETGLSGGDRANRD